jgi:hypothetical protein
VILVYSPEYSEMQRITTNRRQIFDAFHEIASRYQVPVWDYSGWRHAGSTEYFTNSQHLNAAGAQAFSTDLAAQLNEYIRSAGVRESLRPEEAARRQNVNVSMTR